jgi:hypothetical protein
MQVRDGHNCREFAFHDEKHTKRETMKNGSSKFAEHEWKAQQPVLDACECGAKFDKQFRPKAFPFAVVPQCGLKGIEFRFRSNF